jgi:hypothetical protein
MEWSCFVGSGAVWSSPKHALMIIIIIYASFVHVCLLPRFGKEVVLDKI